MKKSLGILLPVLVIGGLVWWFFMGRGDEPHTPPIGPQYTTRVNVDVGLDEEARDVWHHTGEGSGAMPLSMVISIQNPDTEEPFLDGVERYGLIRSPSNTYGLPIGLGVDAFRPDGSGAPMIGVNCSACHTGMWTYEGTAMVVDGAPNMMDVEVLFDILSHSAEASIRSPVAFGELVIRAFAAEAALDQGDPTFEMAAEDLRMVRRMLEAGADRAHVASRRHLARTLHDAYHAATPEEADRLLREGVEAADRRAGHPDHAGAVRGVLGNVRGDLQWLRGHLGMLRVIQEGFANETQSGPGRADSFDIIWDLELAEDSIIGLGAPVSVPALFNYRNTRWVHWDGNSNTVLRRHYAQAIALGAQYDPETHSSGVLPRSVIALEEAAREIGVPAWPEDILGPIDTDLVTRGEAIFGRECAQCHAQDSAILVPVEEIGTDRRRVDNFERLTAGGRTYPDLLIEVGDAMLRAGIREHNLDSAELAAVRRTDTPTWRATGGYMARSLDGLWASPPYLHNGSVPTVWDLLHPPSERPATFPVGRELDPDDLGLSDTQVEDAFIFDTSLPGNLNTGHEHGWSLTDPQKRALIEYLKTR